MSVTRSPRDIAFRLSEKGHAMSGGRRWEAFTLPGSGAGSGARGWFDFNNSAGNQLISKYLAARMARAEPQTAPGVDFEDADESLTGRPWKPERGGN